MTTSQPSQPSGWFTGRTRLITIVSIVAVGLAGATAVSANIGILDAASDNTVGNVSAAGDLTTPSTQVIDVYLPTDAAAAPTTAVTSAPAGASTAVQEFTVDVAGTVAVASTDAGLRLDSVTPTTGWNWTLAQTSQTELMVTMSDGARTLEFVATTTVDGNIVANVNEPIVTPAPMAAPPSANGSTYSGDDDEHEGEYEGGGDDD
jgi:hypothetical protein